MKALEFARRDVLPSLGWAAALALALGISQAFVDAIQHPDFNKFSELNMQAELEGATAETIKKADDAGKEISKDIFANNYFAQGNLYAIATAVAGGAGIRYASRNH